MWLSISHLALARFYSRSLRRFGDACRRLMLAWPVAIDTTMGLVDLTGKRNAEDGDKVDPYFCW